MDDLDALVRDNGFTRRLETDLYFPDLLAVFGRTPVEMERIGLGIWNVLPVNVNDLGHMLIGVPRDEQDELGTSVFFQPRNGLTAAIIAGLLLQLLERDGARFMTPDGHMVTPEFTKAEPTVEGSAYPGLTH